MHDAGTDDLWTVNFHGSNASRLLDCADSCRYFDDPAWSPDGTEVMYARTELVDTARTTVDTLETVDVATGKVDVILTAQP